MAPLKAKGDLAEMMVAADLLRRGYKIAFPYYVPSAAFDGHSELTLRLRPTRNKQRARIRPAEDYLHL
jgi:hypothetical protein